MSEPTPTEVENHLLQHLVESASMKADIAHIKSQQNELSSRLLVQMGEVGADIKAIRAVVDSVPEKINACRADMRREIERDFPSRVDAVKMEQRIETKIAEGDARLSAQIESVKASMDKLWVKITSSVIGAAAVLGFIAWVIDNIHPGVLK